MSSLNTHPADFPQHEPAVPLRPDRFWQTVQEASRSGGAPQSPDEFPEHAAVWPENLSRREFLSVMGASLALAASQGCTRPPDEKIVPYVRQPELIVPGKPLYFATAMSVGGASTGLLVKSVMGRPIKIEGNPRHPSVPPVHGGSGEGLDEELAVGASDIFAQAALLSFYDPDRSQTVTYAGQISTWDTFLTQLRPRLDAQKGKSPHGLRVLTETVNSPTLVHQLETLEKTWPGAWVQYEPVNRDNDVLGAWLAFGEVVNTHYHIEHADVVLSIDADFLCSGPDHLQHARKFADARRVQGVGRRAEMNRLYVIQTTPTLTGTAADHALPLRQAELDSFVRALASRLGVLEDTASESQLSPAAKGWLGPLVSDLRTYRRRGEQEGQRRAGLVVPGLWQPPAIHALAHAINEKLGSVGTAVTYTKPAGLRAEKREEDRQENNASAELRPVGQTESLRRLVDDMQAGRVEMLVIVGGNPAYTAPADVDFAAALDHVPFIVHLGEYQNETSTRCRWHIPEVHFLEAWSDARAYDGTVTIVQPLIAPLYQGKSPHELVAALLGAAGQSAHEIVRQHWQTQRGSKGFEAFWQTTLHDGVMPGTRWSPAKVSLRKDFPARLEAAVKTKEPASGKGSSGGIDIVFRPDPTIWDGRFANNGWLQELPKPLTKLTWDNAVLIGPALAESLRLPAEDVVRLEFAGGQVQGPVWIVPAHPPDSVTVHLGHGRTRAGRVGDGVGFNAYELRPSEALWFAHGATIQPAQQRGRLACTQRHMGLDEPDEIKHREIIQAGTLEEYNAKPADPPFVHAHDGEPASLHPKKEYTGQQWGMSIDVGGCLGCSACVIACQAENNIPVVGKEQVAMGREMHWIRVDTYYEGEPAAPGAYHQPIPCMHCETAPCEPVCPVYATVHSKDGLNQMIYNRCVGTRYCSNNCPYKVRRFNFLQYSDLETPSLKLLHNPEVTVRNRGVMEKCTYCIQRISAARIEAEKEGRRIRDGEVLTACQAACPTRAIVFGDINDETSEVRARKELTLDYALLGELNTRPRTTYLAAIKNPNPLLAAVRARPG